MFGCFASQGWSLQPNYYGTGESFVWRNRSKIDDDFNPDTVDIYRWSGANEYILLSDGTQISVGGG